MTTGWPPGLLQDDSRELARWFASRLDARRVVRKVCEEIRMNRFAQEARAIKGEIGMKDQREAFEEWAAEELFDLERTDDGSVYYSFGTDSAWRAWQAAIASCKREPLTEWELTDLYQKWKETPGTSAADFARAIEAAHDITEDPSTNV